MIKNFLITKYPALVHQNYRRYWVASLASVGATQLISMAQGWLVWELSESALMLGYLGMAAAVPNMAVTLFGGVIADSFDKRQIIRITSVVSTLLLATLAILDYLGSVQVWQVLVIVSVFSLVTGIEWPARSAIYPQLVPRSAFMSAVALNAFIWQATRMIFPVAGGALIFFSGTWLVFALGACGFLSMHIIMTLITTSEHTHNTEKPLHAVFEGIRFILNQPLFLWLMILTFLSMFFVNSYVQILPMFADLLEIGEAGYGNLLAAGGLGAVIGSLLIGGVHQYRRLGWLLLICAATASLCLYLFAAGIEFTNPWVAFAAAFGISLFVQGFMVSAMTIMQLEVPDHLRGRVMGLQTMGYSLVPLGGLFMGAMANRYSGVVALVVSASVFLSLVTLVGLRDKPIRQLDGTDYNN